MRSKFVLSNDQLQGIGAVVVESTYLEVFVEELIWGLAGVNKESGKFFTDGLRLKARIELVGDLGKARITTKKRLAEFTALISDLKIAADDRNAIVHGVWTPYVSHNAEKTGLVHWTVAEKRRLRSAPVKISPKNIHKTAQHIWDLQIKLINFAMTEWPDLPVAWI